MADKRTQRQQKKREKQRLKRDSKQKARREQNRDARGGLSQAVRWPVGTCYLSQNWHEQGAHVHACFVRTHGSGRCAVVLCEVDLAERGVIDLRADVVPSEDHVRALLADRSEPHAMLETAAELVVKVIVEGESHGRTGGHTPPRAIEKARPLWADVDLDGTHHEVLVGTEPKASSKSVEAGGSEGCSGGDPTARPDRPARSEHPVTHRPRGRGARACRPPNRCARPCVSSAALMAASSRASPAPPAVPSASRR